MSRPPIDPERLRAADERLERAKRLDPTITERPVPLDDILANAAMRKTTYTVKEAAALTGYSEQTIRRAIDADELKAAGGGKRGAVLRISGVELERWWRDVKGGGDLFPAHDE